MLTVFLLLSACGNVTLTPSEGGCTDINLADPPASSVESETDPDGSVRVYRAAAFFDQTGLVFAPELVTEGDVLHVHEAWSGGETEDAFCYQPTVTVTGLAAKLQVRWYLEGEDTPFDTVEIAPS